MTEQPSTRASLLLRIRDQRDQQAWSLFVDLYTPLIYGYVRKQGYQDADAADVAQDVLRVVSKRIGTLDYDPNKGRFRNWLLTVVRSKLHDHLAKQKKGVRGAGGSSGVRSLAAQPDDDAQLAEWDREYEQQIFALASQQVRSQVQENTWQAFELTAVEGKKAKVVAAELGMTVAAVYLAKSRVTERLKTQIAQLQIE